MPAFDTVFCSTINTFTISQTHTFADYTKQIYSTHIMRDIPRYDICVLWLSLCKFPGNWEIPFELISDLQWLGSGAQGAVFMGQLNDEAVAVKKVRNVDETNVLHLRKLTHPNIIKFKSVISSVVIPCIYSVNLWYKRNYKYSEVFLKH